MSKRIVFALAAPVAAVVFAVLVSSAALLIAGHNPLRAYEAMWTYADSTESVVAIINRAVPFYIAALAVAIGFKMNLFNIGVDGQYRIAAVLAAAAAAEVSLPAPLHVGFALLIAMAAGMAWAAIAGVLKVTRGVSEVISTIMLNSIATGLTAYLLQNYFRETDGTLITKTEPIPASGLIPNLDRLLAAFGFNLPPRVDLYGTLVLAIVAGVGFYVVVWRTRFGYDLRASGTNPWAARTSGVNPNAMVLRTMLISGAIAGLIGMQFVLAEEGRYTEQFPATLGFTGISVALVGRNHPGGIAVGALLFAFIERSTQVLATQDIPQAIARIMQGSIILSAVVAYEVVRRIALAAEVKAAAARADSRASGSSDRPITAVPV